MQKKKKFPRITTPIGTAQWPWLKEPDTKFDKDGVYRVNLRMTKEEGESTVKEITKILDSYVKQLKDDPQNKNIKIGPLPIKDVEDEDGVPTGEIEFKFKMKAVVGSGADKWEQRPAIFDSQKRPMSENIGGGSRMRIGAELIPYNSPAVGVGISLRLKTVQVIDLVEFGGGLDPDSWEFDKEDGFVTSGETSENSTMQNDHDF